MPQLLDAIEAHDGDVRELSFLEEDLSLLSVGHVEFEDCTFEGCSFSELQVARASFERCTFTSCDFSNARMSTSFWRDCVLRESRLVGCDLHHGYFVRDTFHDCVCSYANLAESKLEQVSFHGCDLHEASLSQLRLKRLVLDGCDLTRAELFRSRLQGVDLSGCAIAGMRVSDTFAELHGAKIGIEQAPELMGLLGVKIV